MSQSIIHSYQAFNSLVSAKNDIYKVIFKLSGVHSSLANGIRRTLLSSLPIVALDDTYMDNPEDNSIKMKKNISALHNEFVSHRLSLMPICMYYNDSLRVSVDYDFEACEFNYKFLHEDAVPTFLLKIKNDAETRKVRGSNADSSIDITSNFIEIENPNEFNPVEEFIRPDYITGDYCLLHRLKPISSNEDVQEAEELEIVMRPTINTARIHARHCPVGTVSYEFEKDSQAVQDKYFAEYIDNLQRQRANDKLAPFSDKDVEVFRGSFNVMGSERVYKRTQYDEPETVLFCVESVGNLEAHQLVYDAISMIKLKTVVLMNHFEWNEKAGGYSYNPHKVQIQKNNQSGFVDITIYKEDHTLGNLIGSYLKKLFVTDKLLGDMLDFASYRLPHPLEERIVVSIGFKDGVDFSALFARMGLKPANDEMTTAIQCMFLACSQYLKQLGMMAEKWKEFSGISETSFRVEDKELLRGSYYDKSQFI